jgi:hypothetical protein
VGKNRESREREGRGRFGGQLLFSMPLSLLSAPPLFPTHALELPRVVSFEHRHGALGFDVTLPLWVGGRQERVLARAARRNEMRVLLMLRKRRRNVVVDNKERKKNVEKTLVEFTFFTSFRSRSLVSALRAERASMAPSSSSLQQPPFSLEDVSARIAQLRAQLRAGSSGGDVANANPSFSSSSRFSALVELGGLLATCPLPEYTAPVRREMLQRWIRSRSFGQR